MKIPASASWCLVGQELDHPRETTIDRLFQDLLETDEDQLNRVALINAETNAIVTYGELNERANCMARMLLRKIKKGNLKPNPDGDYIVALRFLPGEQLVATILAIFKAGLAYVPIAPNWPEGRIEHIIADAAPIVVITNTNASLLYKAQKDLPVDQKREIFQYEDLMEEGNATNTSSKNLPSNQILNASTRGERLFAVLYTSGSTGRPKGVRHVHRAALNRFHWQWATFPYTRDEVCVFKTTLTFVDSVIEIWSPLLSGKQLVIFPTKVTQNVEKFVEGLEQYNIGRIFVVTSLVKSILTYLSLSKKHTKRMSSVKIWECSAETVTKDVLLAFFAYFKTGHTISNFYGSTEMSDVTYESFTSPEEVMSVLKDDKVPIGVPVDNTKAYVLDENMEPVDEGAIGSLYITGRNLGDGYVGAKKGSFMENHINNRDAMVTNQASPNNYDVLYKTGDYATIKNGRLYYEGRLDAQIKVRGHRVDLAEIDKAVLAVEGVAKTCVLCFRPGEAQQKVLCYYTTISGVVLPEAKLQELLALTLPCYMMPRLTKLPTLPLLVNGKTDRQALFQKYEETLACTTFTFTEEDFTGHVEAALFPQAKVVLESVASVLRDVSKKPTLSDAFFEMGGDSINMVLVIARITDHGYHIPMTQFVLASTLADVVMALSTQQEDDDLSAVIEKMKQNNEYTSAELEPEHKKVVLDMISRSFAEKGDLTTLAAVSYDVLQEQLDILWPALLEAKLSIVVKDKSGWLKDLSCNPIFFSIVRKADWCLSQL